MNYPNLKIVGNFGEYIPTEIVDIYIEDQHHLANKKKKRDLNNYNKLVFKFKCIRAPFFKNSITVMGPFSQAFLFF